MVRTVLAHVGSILALIVAVLMAGDLSTLLAKPLNVTFVFSAIAAAILLALWDCVQTARLLPKRFAGKKRNDKVRAYMVRLISSEGRCVLSSNDLSWVKDDALEALLKKAGQKSLKLLMPVPTDLSGRLVEAGAEALYYGENGLKLKSRFTIVNHDRHDTWVAVGMGTREAHIIREIQSNDDPTFHMATDLVRLAERSSVSSSR